MLEADGDGVILARKPNGDLYYYRWLADEERWMIPGGKIGSGWGEVSSIHMGPNGYVYAQRQDGALMYYEISNVPRVFSSVRDCLDTHWRVNGCSFPSVCGSDVSCIGMAEVYYNGVVAFGQESYDNANTGRVWCR